MIRLYRDFGSHLAMCLHYLSKGSRVGIGDVQHYTARSAGFNSKEQMALRGAIRAPASDLPSLEDMFTQLVTQIHEDGQDRDTDLIDLIVNTLQLPHAQNTLSGDRIARLKQAILLPSELASLGEKLRLRELSCGNCGGKIHDGEAVTLRYNGNRQGPSTLYCAACVGPDQIACRACKKPVPATSTGLSYLCAACLKGTPAKKDEKKGMKYKPFNVNATTIASNTPPPDLGPVEIRQPRVTDFMAQQGANIATPDPGMGVLAAEPVPPAGAAFATTFNYAPLTGTTTTATPMLTRQQWQELRNDMAGRAVPAPGQGVFRGVDLNLDRLDAALRGAVLDNDPPYADMPLDPGMADDLFDPIDPEVDPQ